MPLLDLFWTTLIVFGWVLWFMLLFRVYGDLFTRRDISGWVKTAWVVVTLLVPVVGVLVYLIAQGRGMAERQIRAVEQQQRATEAYIRSVAADAEAEQLQKARALLQSGAVTPAEYQQMVPAPRA
ncbi:MULTISPECIES: PLDc N-terminal domain-containing protein [unclassified Geodermatophilus]